MGKVELLANNYERHLSVPWQRSVSGAQRVMLLVYDKEQERSLRARLGEFEIKTRNAGHEWLQHDCAKKWTSADHRVARVMALSACISEPCGAILGCPA